MQTPMQTHGSRLRSIGALLLLIVAIVSVKAQPGSESLDLLADQIASHFQSGRLDLALPLAIQFRDQAIKLEGPKSERAAKGHENLGAIYRAQNDCKNAADNFRIALEVRRQRAPESLVNHLQLLQALGACQIKLAEFNDAALTYRLATASIRSKDEKQFFPLIVQAANAEAQAKNFVQANDLYKRAYKSFVTFFEPNDPVLKQLLAYRTCYFDRFPENEALQKDYRDANKAVDQSNPRGVKNGKATSLEPAPYPITAKVNRLGGTVFVLVDINEKGKVTDASVICSDPVLGGAAIASARRARFSPTLKNGAPISTFGLVTYKFIPPR